MHKIPALLLFVISSAAFAETGPDSFQLPAPIADYFSCAGKPECFFLKKHIERDSVSCLPDPREILEQAPSLDRGNSKALLGKIRYLGMFAKKYHYTFAMRDDGSLLVSSFIAIKNKQEFSADELAQLQARLDGAAALWTDSFRMPRVPFTLRFRFLLVDERQAFFKVRLVHKYTRGPYDTEWSTAWRDSTFAHEMGHVMGLDDEYENKLGGGDSTKCIQDSLMCVSNGLPKDFHYYLILRRLACAYDLSGEPAPEEGGGQAEQDIGCNIGEEQSGRLQ